MALVGAGFDRRDVGGFHQFPTVEGDTGGGLGDGGGFEDHAVGDDVDQSRAGIEAEVNVCYDGCCQVGYCSIVVSVDEGIGHERVRR